MSGKFRAVDEDGALMPLAPAQRGAPTSDAEADVDLERAIAAVLRAEDRLELVLAAAAARAANPEKLNFSPADWRSNLQSLLTSSRRPDAVYLLADAAIFDQTEHISALALEQRIPTLGSMQDTAYAGALLAYGGSVATIARRVGYYVRRILEGTNPADLPVEQATRVGTVVNLKSARALGVNVPDELLARADDVIE
jgi:putative ABC transport system substrate-binding protein